MCPLGVDALSLAAVAHANRSLRLLRLGVATEAVFISRTGNSSRGKYQSRRGFSIFRRPKVTAERVSNPLRPLFFMRKFFDNYDKII